MSRGKGGSTTSKVQVPKYIEDATKANLGTARKIAQLDYVPYYGPDVAAATPQQQASWQGANQAADAFGMPTADISIPQAQDFGGVQGYSGGSIYDLALQELQQRRPQQYAARQNLFGKQQNAQQPAQINPFTGMSMQSMQSMTPEQRMAMQMAQLQADRMGGGNR